MYTYENRIWGSGTALVCGIDEAGRGPLAGPVYAAAVILRPGEAIEGVDDSKKLSEKKRDALYDVICARAAAFCIARVDEDEIDRINILQASLLAMTRAFEGLSLRPEAALVDGNKAPDLKDTQVLTIIKGDSKSASIAAASILAKVARDRFMLELDAKYPAYDFARHKGYPTKLHYERILAHGVSPVHRRSFLRKLPEELLK